MKKLPTPREFWDELDRKTYLAMAKPILLQPFGIMEPQNPLSGQQEMMLAGYNSEVARGLVHTDGWKATMKRFQEQFDSQIKGERFGSYILQP